MRKKLRIYFDTHVYNNSHLKLYYIFLYFKKIELFITLFLLIQYYLFIFSFISVYLLPKIQKI